MAETPVLGLYQSSETDTKRKTIEETANTMQKIEDEFLHMDKKMKERSVSINNYSHLVLLTNPMGEDWTPAAIQAANEVEDGGSVFFPNGNEYLLNEVKVDGKSVRFTGNKSLIIQGENKPVFNLSGTLPSPVAVTGISTVNVDLSLGDSKNTEVTKIDTATAGINVGDIFKLTSDDTIPGSWSWMRRAEFCYVLKVDATSIYVSKIRESYPTNPKIILHPKTTFSIEGLKFKAHESGDAAGWNSAMVSINHASGLNFRDLECLGGYGAFIAFKNIHTWNATDIRIKDLKNDQAKGRYGYGIHDQSSENGNLSEGIFINVRHGYTTGGTEYGKTAFTKVSDCMATSCSNAGFDTHAESYMVVFNNCSVWGSYAGSNSAGSAFQSRGEKEGFVACTADNCYSGFQFFESSKEGYIEYCKAKVKYRAILINKMGAAQKETFTIRGGEFESLGETDGLLKVINANVKIFDKPQFNLKTASGNYVMAIHLIDSSLQFDDMVLDMSVYGGTNGRFITAVNSQVNGERVRLLKGTAALNNLFAGDSGGNTRLNIKEATVDTSGVTGLLTGFTTANYRLNLVADDNGLNTMVYDQDLGSDGLATRFGFGTSLSNTIMYQVNPQTANRTIGTFDNGSKIGQRLVVRNKGSFNATINPAANVLVSAAKTILPSQSLSLIWNGAAWITENS